MRQDFETFLTYLQKPTDAILYFTNLISQSVDSEWNLYTAENKEGLEKLLNCNFAIRRCAKYISRLRKKSLRKIENNLKSSK